nr:hypothetical protein [Tanacetum cinerariifolium]
MINFIDITCEDHFRKVLKIKKSNHPSSGSTTPLFDSFSSLTPFKTSDSLLKEFTYELNLLDPFPPRNEDDNFDLEDDLREIEYLLNRDPSTESLPKSDIVIIDPILERFTDDPALVYSPPQEMTMMTMMIFLTLNPIMMNGKSFWIDNDIYSTVNACPNACEMWKAIERLKQGESINIQDLETNLFWEFGKFTSQDGESLESYYSRFYKMIRFVTLVKHSQELKNVSYHKLYDILKQHQHEVNEIRAKKIACVANPLALVAEQQPVYHPQTHPTHYNQNSST